MMDGSTTVCSCFRLKTTWKCWTGTEEWLKDVPKLVAAHVETVAEATFGDELWAFARLMSPAAASFARVTGNDHCDCPAPVHAMRKTLVFTELAQRTAAKPGASMPTSLESIALIALVLGRMGLLTEAMPRCEAAGIWGPTLGLQGEDESSKALQESLAEFVTKATESREEVLGVKSCCNYHPACEKC